MPVGRGARGGTRRARPSGAARAGVAQRRKRDRRCALQTSGTHAGLGMTHNRLTIEKLGRDALDVCGLNRAGLLSGGWVEVQAPFRWPRIAMMRLARHRIQIELHNQSVPQSIRVSWTQCHFGGARPWLHCPYCDRRVARLFRGMAGYSCRGCLGNPVYESQRRSSKARAWLQACRLRQRLDGSRPVVDAMPVRPPGMKQKTYQRLCTRIRRLELPLVGSRVTRHAPAWIPPLLLI